MKERVQIERFVKRIFLRKSLYFSLLSIFFLGTLGIIIAAINLWFLPDLNIIQGLFKGYIILSILTLAYGPLRYLLLGILSAKLSDQFKAKTVKIYDGGRFTQSLDLRGKGSLGNWSSQIATRESNTVLADVITTLRFHWTFKYFLVGALLSILSLLIFNKPITTSTTEIVTGNLRSSLTPSDLPDTLFAEIYTKPNIQSFTKLGFVLVDLPEKVTNNSIHTWKYKGRDLKSTWIICDSIITVKSWSAVIQSPEYTGLSEYTVSDTIKAINGSKVKVLFKGVLTDFLKPNVPRETLNKGFIRVTSGIEELEFKGLNQSYSIPVEVREDLKPVIEVVSNSYDSVFIKVYDDFQLSSVFINNNNTNSSVFDIYWGDDKSLNVIAFDNLKQQSTKEVKRPERKLDQLRSDINNSLPSTFTKFSEIKKPTLSSQSEKKETKKEKKDPVENKKLERNQDKTEERLDTNLEKELEELWEIQKLIEALEMVSRETNDALDSLINESIEELENSENKAIQDEINQLKQLDKEGQEREEQAKESAQKLKQLLAESTVDIQIDNIERIKRLLKNSWKTSVQQEVNKAIQSGSKYREQRSLIQIQKEISDSLDALLITDPMLGMVLNDVSISIDDAVKELESAILLSKNIQVKTAYMVTALNELNAVLYDILESEKMSLASAKKQCKKGKPGKTGKPSKGKDGKKPSPKPVNKEGKKPGKKGEPRKPGEQGIKPGENGRGTKELLKELDNRLGDSDLPGGSEQREALEQLKREILFGNPKENESQEAFENRLWESLKSEFDKEEKGNDRKSNSGDESTSDKGIEIRVVPSNNRVSDLPLPILKKK